MERTNKTHRNTTDADGVSDISEPESWESVQSVRTKVVDSSMVGSEQFVFPEGILQEDLVNGFTGSICFARKYVDVEARYGGAFVVGTSSC